MEGDRTVTRDGDGYAKLNRKVWDFLIGSDLGRKILAGRRIGTPGVFPENGTLKEPREWQSALEQVRRLKLPLHPEPTKNWDNLAALACILRRTTKEARILDAGSERYSVILPWLCLYGYVDLYGINLVFDSAVRLGPITYEHGDVTGTRFETGSFDAVTCLSVVEHGVDTEKYFREMSRILKRGGVLITSVDYYETPVETAGKECVRNARPYLLPGGDRRVDRRRRAIRPEIDRAAGPANGKEGHPVGEGGPGVHVPSAHDGENLVTPPSALRRSLLKVPILNRMVDPLSNARKMVRTMFSPNRKFLTLYPPGHYHSPIPDVEAVLSGGGPFSDRTAEGIPAVDLNESAQADLAESFSKYLEEGVPFPENPAEGKRYYFRNSFFSYGDAVVFYGFLRHFRPRKVIEVGSGFSSALLLDVKESHLGGQVDAVFIEPFPERLRMLFSAEDRERCRIIEKPVQEVEPGLFRTLDAGDLLFIDSSHVGKVRSDVGYIIHEILPALRGGVFVHFHDIPWPFEYPEAWFRLGRAWNEAYMIRAFLQYNNTFEIIYFNSMMEKCRPDLLKERMPLALKSPDSPDTLGNSSLWLRKLR